MRTLIETGTNNGGSANKITTEMAAEVGSAVGGAIGAVAAVAIFATATVCLYRR